MDADGILMLSRLWPIGAAFVAIIVWLVRLEGAVKMNTKLRHELSEELDELKQEFKDHRNQIWMKADSLRDMVNGKH